MLRYNPFRPGNLVTPGMFSGRFEELMLLKQVLFQTKNGNPQHFLIHGERGIGKSSLLLFLHYLSRGEVSFGEGEPFKFLAVSVELEPSNTFWDIIMKIGTELQRTVYTHQRVKDIVKKAWDFLKGWEVCGVKYSGKDRGLGPHEMLDDLTYTVEQTFMDIKEEYDGILITIDEADKPPVGTNLGEFAKIFTERLMKRGCGNVCLGLAGISGVLETLKKSHESSPRVFEVITLEPLLWKERIDVVRKGLAEAKQKNGFEITIDQEAEDCISTFSEGYPHFIQQFAYSAFEEDKDNNIDVQDVGRGVFKENGAFQQLGLKYFHDLYFEQIYSDEYREVLRTMSEHWDGWVSKDDIRKSTKIKPTTLNNAIIALKSRKIIIARPGKKGEYRLPNKSFAAWIKGYTQAPEKVCIAGNSVER